MKLKYALKFHNPFQHGILPVIAWLYGLYLIAAPAWRAEHGLVQPDWEKTVAGMILIVLSTWAAEGMKLLSIIKKED